MRKSLIAASLLAIGMASSAFAQSNPDTIGPTNGGSTDPGSGNYSSDYTSDSNGIHPVPSSAVDPATTQSIGGQAIDCPGMLPPGQEIRWRILETDADGPLLAATFAGRKKPLTGRTLGFLLTTTPFLTVKIMAGIHWEALKLWLKGAIYVRRPPPPPPVSVKPASRLAEAAE